jgi:hypothetical protein
MKKSKIAIVILVCLCLIAFKFRHPIKNNIIYWYGKMMNKGPRKNNTICKNCDVLFNDGINAHEKAYKYEGIKEQDTDEGLIQLGKKNVLKEIENNDFYVVQDFTHSQPLLLPKAIDFINELSILYQQKCTEKNLDYVRYEITSGTRSRESVKRLGKENENSIKNSPHLRGKTFDMSWGAFGGNEAQFKLFKSALSELKNQFVREEYGISTEYGRIFSFIDFS